MHPPGCSTNDSINIRDFPLHYTTVYNTMDTLGHNALMAKLDVKSAFHLCPVHPADHHLLGIRWQGQYYFDQVLPFGLHSAPCIFNHLVEAIEWLAVQSGVTHIHHYLDDFWIAGAPTSLQCSHHLSTLTTLCGSLGVPLAEEKLEGPAALLGIPQDPTGLGQPGGLVAPGQAAGYTSCS